MADTDIDTGMAGVYQSAEGIWTIDADIVQHPNPILLSPTVEVREFSIQLHALAGLMLKSMRKWKGIGLAANQIGVGLRLAVMHVPGWGEMVMVNPRITKTKGEGVHSEGCLSVKRSKHWVPVKRAKIVWVEYQTLDGEPRRLKANDLLGRCVQHECDHLDGLTCLEKTVEVSQ